ncbi:putative phiE125 gp8 family phage protein [Rhizobium skierniewicense]|uniref:Putative phiE125 gp8 family phage protein n=1 Tax=Rhizobium skierniewicense TaxID=984260 RepID=A0A7W6C7I7_9HYPH|nr:head-tail connector protein [Rhizobium skierniewicense]MBB3947185.1 putative phiE125 gp8 family phage protein [Rhizobium skierniewicense]
MTYAQLTPPQAEALTLADVKAHLRLDGDDEDALLTSLIATARDYLERQTGLCLMRQSFRLYLDDWPLNSVILIAKGPVQAIETILVFDDAGDPFDVTAIEKLLDGEGRPARLWVRQPPAPGQPLNGIEIDFTAGFGESGADVPDTLKRAMLVHIAHMYAFRGAVSPADQPAGVPRGYERLIAPFCRTGL